MHCSGLHPILSRVYVNTSLSGLRICNLLGGNLTDKENLYEVMQRVALLEENKFFVNRQISTFKEYQSNGINIPNLIDFSNSKLVAEGTILLTKH